MPTDWAWSRVTPTVSVVVATYRRPEQLRRTIEALRQQSYPAAAYEVVVVDDGNEPVTRQVAEAFRGGPQTVAYISQPHQGAAAARNAGARASRGEVLLFVDDDIVLQPDAFGRYVAALQRFAPCCVNGHWEFASDLVEELRRTPFGLYRLDIEDWVRQGLRMTPIDERFSEVELLTACNLAVPAKDFWRIGAFDPSFPYAGYEDQEFSIRARELGYRLVYDRDLVCLHDDRRLSRLEYLERVRRGAFTATLLWSKRPREFGGHALIRENDALRFRERPPVTFKKALKSILSTALGLSALQLTTDVVETVWPSRLVLRRLYRILTAVYLFIGVRQGLKQHSRALAPRPSVPGSV